MSVKLSAEEMRYIALFENLTGARARDCLINNNEGRLTFVVRKGDIGLAIGKGGNKIRKVRQMIGKRVEIIEHSDDPREFVKNSFTPAKVKEVSITEQNGKKVALVTIEERDKGLAVGHRGRNIERAKKLGQRHCGIDDISLA